MIDSSKPDLEESVNVTAAHERVLSGAAAAAREKKLSENGAEPMSLWVFALCAIPLIGAGLALGKAGNLFDYKNTVRADYVRLIPDDGEGDALPPKTALDAYIAKGAKIYSKCNGCHGSNGQGDGASYPSLAGSDWVNSESTERLAMVILNGLQGPTSTGKTYGVMPAQSAGMSAEDLACLMTFLRNSFGNTEGDVITKEMAATAFEISNARSNPGSPVSAAELDADHKKPLPGDPLDPATLLDPVTLEPAEAP